MLSLTRWFFIFVISLLAEVIGITNLGNAFLYVWSFLLVFCGIIFFTLKIRNKFLPTNLSEKIGCILLGIGAPVAMLSIALITIRGISTLLSIEFTSCFLIITFWLCFTNAIKSINNK